MSSVPTRAVAHLALSLLLGTAAFLMLGMRVGYPYHRMLAMGLWAGALLLFAWALRERRKWLRVHKKLAKRRLRPYVPHLIVGGGLCVFAYVAWVLMPVEPSELTGMTQADLRGHLDADRSLVLYLDDSLEGAVTALQAAVSGPASPGGTPAERRVSILEAWQQFVHSSLELDGLKQKYKGFYQIDYVTSPTLHADAFYLAYAAYVVQYHRALTLVELVDEAPSAEVFLNEASSVYGIPGETFYRLKQRLTLPDTLLRLNAGRAYLALVNERVSGSPAVVEVLRQRLEAIDRLAGSKPDLLLDNPLDWLEKNAYRAWFPVQKKVALHMSQVRGKDRPYFISPTLAKACIAKLQPGDILLERRSWHLTNAGIPGFWPHAALYTGSPEEMNVFFAGLPELGGREFSEVLAEQFPLLWAEYQSSPDSPRRVIEAKRPGVILNTLEDSANADYLAALRPRVDRGEIYHVLRRAYAHFGKPYDFNFDFATDNALVCSELVFKAYQGVEGIQWKPVSLNGRSILPPNEIARQYALQYESETQPPEFLGGTGRVGTGLNAGGVEWVLFLDGREREETAVWGSEAAFRESWRRPKWELMLD